MIQLINDFQHIHIYHWDHCELFNEFEKILNECFIPQSISFKRHFRDRSLYKNDITRYKLYFLQCKNNGKRSVDRGDRLLLQKEIICMQWMDEIHCYLRHSLMRFEGDDESDDDDEYTETDYTRDNSFGSRSRNSFISNRTHSPSNSRTNLSVNSKNNFDRRSRYSQTMLSETAHSNITSKYKQSLNMQLMMQRKEEYDKYGYGRSYGRDKHNKENKNDEDDEIKHNEELSSFEWQSTLNSKSNIKPRYNSMKDEILNNPYYKLSMLEWNELYFKCEQISKTWIRKKIKAKDKYSGMIGINKLKIKKGDTISIEFMMAIKLYTDYDKLQFELKRCLRGERARDLSYLYLWRNIILICVSKFGIKMKKHKFFYGCNSKMEFTNFGGFGLFNGPLSLTISLEVAKQYATHDGMLMQIGNAHPWIKGNDNGNGRYFDVSCLSDFKNEHEILTMLFTTRLHMISLNCYIDENINNISIKLFKFICKLFEKCIFSMNFELENLFIQLINNQLKNNQNDKNIIIPKKYALKFNKLCIERENLLIWDISYGLQDFFMISTEYDGDFDDDSITIDNISKYNDEENETKLLICFEKINQLFINLKCLTLINHTLSNEIFYQFIDYLNKNKGNVSYQIITFYFPKYKKLPHLLKISQLQHVWQKYLAQHKWHIVAYKYGASLSPMIVIKRINTKLKPFMGSPNIYHQFVKIEK